jgi:hypothetical protein
VYDIVFFNPLEDEFVGVVSGTIINDDYFKVFIVEIDHRLQIVLIAEVACVVDGGHYNAKGEFGKSEVVFLGQSISVFLFVGPAFIFDINIEMGKLKVVQGKQEGVLGLPRLLQEGAAKARLNKVNFLVVV